MLSVLFIIAFARAGELCASWEKPVEVGKLDTALLGEASGLAVSRKYDRLYHVNDSGDGPAFYQTARDGSAGRKIKIKGYKPCDTEDLAIGACPAPIEGTCLVIADIGDNRRRRETIELLYIKEEEKFADEVAPAFRQTLKYPDGAHNAEAIVTLPHGGVVIATKESKEVTLPSRFYRWKPAAATEKVATLETIGELDVPTIVNNKIFGGLVTSMDRSSDGSKFILLTYDKVIEVKFDLESGPLPKKPELKVVTIAPLAQQESIAYDTNDKDFLYTTEFVGSALVKIKGKQTPIMKTFCTGAKK